MDYKAADPVAMRPSYDIAGLSSYDFEARGDDTDELVLGSYDAMAAVSPRMALAEVGPANSDGSRDPEVITTGLRAAGAAPAYAMFWFDDGALDTRRPRLRTSRATRVRRPRGSPDG